MLLRNCDRIIDDLSVGGQVALIAIGNIAMLDEHELQDENTSTPSVQMFYRQAHHTAILTAS
jgi:hypothetical protein